jgi:hypothetical protein
VSPASQILKSLSLSAHPGSSCTGPDGGSPAHAGDPSYNERSTQLDRELGSQEDNGQSENGVAHALER